jgi:CubicO group peptidase (beta-lactamase class C family)
MLQRPVGMQFEYSNLGSAVLGLALARRAATSYEDLVRNRITSPLGMRRTRLSLSAELRGNFAKGHAYALEPTPNWDLGALAPAGGLKSTANDLLTLLEAGLGYRQTRLQAAFAAMSRVRRSSGRGAASIGWLMESHEGGEIVFHSGSTGGYAGFIGFDAKARTGVVVLSNAGAGAGVDDIGFHLLDPSFPLREAAALEPHRRRTEIPVAASVMEAYAGRYRFPSGQAARIRRQGNTLLLEADGEAKVAFFPETEDRFFARLMDAQMTFVRAQDGRAVAMTFTRNGAEVRTERID